MACLHQVATENVKNYNIEMGNVPMRSKIYAHHVPIYILYVSITTRYSDSAHLNA